MANAIPCENFDAEPEAPDICANCEAWKSDHEQTYIWEAVVCLKDGEEYKVLQLDGWEPQQCTLIPAPNATTQGLIGVNGQSFMANFRQVMLMRKRYTREAWEYIHSDSRDRHTFSNLNENDLRCKYCAELPGHGVHARETRDTEQAAGYPKDRNINVRDQEPEEEPDGLDGVIGTAFDPLAPVEQAMEDAAGKAHDEWTDRERENQELLDCEEKNAA